MAMQTAIKDAGRLVPRFLSWWLGELGSLVPAGLRRALAPRVDTLCFAFGGREIVISRYTEDGGREVARLDVAAQDAASQRAEVEAIVRAEATRRTAIVLALPARNALNKTLGLPLAAEQGLKDLLYFELDRQTPYRPEQVRYDYRVVERDPDAQRLRVELLVVPKDSVDRALDQAAEWGIEPAAITVEGLDDPGDPEFDLTGEGRHAGSSGTGRTLAGLLAISAAVLLAAAVYLPLNAQSRVAAEAEHAVQDAMVAAEQASALRDELERAAAAGNFLIERKREAPMVTAILADLTRLFPDDTWLFELQIEGNQVRARGYSPSASSVLELVERGSAFRNAKFASPVTRIPNIDRDRFDLTFDLVHEEGS